MSSKFIAVFQDYEEVDWPSAKIFSSYQEAFDYCQRSYSSIRCWGDHTCTFKVVHYSANYNTILEVTDTRVIEHWLQLLKYQIHEDVEQ